MCNNYFTLQITNAVSTLAAGRDVTCPEFHLTSKYLKPPVEFNIQVHAHIHVKTHQFLLIVNLFVLPFLHLSNYVVHIFVLQFLYFRSYLVQFIKLFICEVLIFSYSKSVVLFYIIQFRSFSYTLHILKGLCMRSFEFI